MWRSSAQKLFAPLDKETSTEETLLLVDQEGQGRLEVRILIVEPSDPLREALAVQLAMEGYQALCAPTAQRAFHMLGAQSFDLVMWNLWQFAEGWGELLREFRGHWPHLPLVCLAHQATLSLVQQALQLGADDFYVCSQPLEEIGQVVERNLSQEALVRRRASRYRNILHASGEAVLDAMLTALALRDIETEGHSLRVTAYTIEMAERMGLDKAEMYHIERGALLHDIGKIGIPDQILLKPGRLTPVERAKMQLHTLIGYNMCARIESLRGTARIVLHHHEAWDGTGYPHGLCKEAIPLGSRIFAIADALDAITSNRPYRPARSLQEAITEIERCAGTQFDPSMVKIALEVPLARWEQLRRFTLT